MGVVFFPSLHPLIFYLSSPLCEFSRAIRITRGEGRAHVNDRKESQNAFWQGYVLQVPCRRQDPFTRQTYYTCLKKAFLFHLKLRHSQQPQPPFRANTPGLLAVLPRPTESSLLRVMGVFFLSPEHGVNCTRIATPVRLLWATANT